MPRECIFPEDTPQEEEVLKALSPESISVLISAQPGWNDTPHLH